MQGNLRTTHHQDALGLPLAHPLRGRVLEELHARPFSPVQGPLRLLHFGFVTDARAADDDCTVLQNLCRKAGIQGPLPNARHFRSSELKLTWERHGEFVTYTFEVDDAAEARWPGDRTAPGPLLIAAELRYLPDRPSHQFGLESIVADGKALLQTDFRPDSFGFVQLCIVDRGLDPDLAGATIQRVLEVETYRCLALLGLPAAEEVIPSITDIEAALPELMAEIDAASALQDNQRLLEQLSGLALSLEKSSAAVGFRLGATRAYDALVRLRLEALEITDVPGRPGIPAFLSRRLNPAIRTCAAIEERQANLSRKLTRAAQLLRTSVDIAMEGQNRDLLAAVEGRLKLQFRLQQTVEGLSIAAISYYVCSLVHLLFAGLAHAVVPFDADRATAFAIVPVILLVSYLVIHVRRKHVGGID